MCWPCFVSARRVFFCQVTSFVPGTDPFVPFFVCLHRRTNMDLGSFLQTPFGLLLISGALEWGVFHDGCYKVAGDEVVWLQQNEFLSHALVLFLFCFCRTNRTLTVPHEERKIAVNWA